MKHEVTAVSPATSPAGVVCTVQVVSEPPSLWLLYVPMAGEPSVTQLENKDEVQQTVATMIENGQTGWIYLFEGIRHGVSVRQASAVKVAGEEQLFGVVNGLAENLLPGTELYPDSAE